MLWHTCFRAVWRAAIWLLKTARTTTLFLKSYKTSSHWEVTSGLPYEDLQQTIRWCFFAWRASRCRQVCPVASAREIPGQHSLLTYLCDSPNARGLLGVRAAFPIIEPSETSFLLFLMSFGVSGDNLQLQLRRHWTPWDGVQPRFSPQYLDETPLVL